MYRCRGEEEEDIFQGNIGKLGVYKGIVNLKARGGGSGGNQSICQVGGNEEIHDKQEKGGCKEKRGDVRRNGGM